MKKKQSLYYQGKIKIRKFWRFFFCDATKSLPRFHALTARLRRQMPFMLALLIGSGIMLFASEPPFHDDEFPGPYDITPMSDTGPKRIGLELDRESIIPNGSFEKWSNRRVEVNPGLPGREGLWESWLLPEGWTYHHWNGPDFTREKLKEKNHCHPTLTTFESCDSHTGKRALNLGFGQSRGGMWFTTELFRIEPGAKYVLSLWIKGHNIGHGSGQIPYLLKVLLRMYHDPKRESLTGVRAFHRIVKVSPKMSYLDWTELRWTFTVPFEVEWAILHLKALQSHSGFLLLVDDVSLVKIVREPNKWYFDKNAGFGNTRRCNTVVGENGLKLAKVRNLAVNGGFEIDADNNEVPDGWKIQKLRPAASLPEDTSLAASLDRTRHTGRRGLKLSGTTGTIQAASSLIDLPEPGQYTLSVYCKSLPRSAKYPPGYATITLHAPIDGTTYSWDIIQYGRGWLRETITFTYPGRNRPTTRSYQRDPGIEILLSFRGSGAVWFDDLQLEHGCRANHLASADTIYADQGETVSEIIDLGCIENGKVAWEAKVPNGRLLHIRTRTGFTPYYDRSTWTDWSQPYHDPKGSPLELQAIGVPIYMQWKACFLRDGPRIITHATLEQTCVKVADVKEWRYCFDPERTGTEQGFAKTDFNDSGWKTIMGVRGPRLPDGPEGFEEGVVWFRTRLFVPKAVGSDALYLRLDPAYGVSDTTCTTLYVNGVEAASRMGFQDTWLSFEHLVQAGKEICLALRIKGAGSDRFVYLKKARVLRRNRSANAANKVTPILRSLLVSAPGSQYRRSCQGDVEITYLRNGEIRPSLIPFKTWSPEDYEKNVKMREIRALAREIVQGIPDEDTQILRLRKHIYALCNYTGNPSAYHLLRPNDTPYDFLHLAVKDRISMYCSHYWLVMIDLAAAVGFIVRPVTTGSMGAHFFWADNVVEYWSNKYNKWVMINTFFDNYFTRDGLPQSAADLMKVWFDDEWQKIESRAGGDITNDFRHFADRAVGPFGWQATPPHTHANSHGWVNCVFVTDNPRGDSGVTLIRPETEPFFIGQMNWTGVMPCTTDAYRLYAPINQTRMRLAFEHGNCRVNAEHNMLNFKHFEFRIGDQGWQTSEQLPLVWALRPGANGLRMRAVNQFGRPGPESTVMLRVSRSFIEEQPPGEPDAGPKKTKVIAVAQGKGNYD